jgi:ferric-dicitrate binding protein FerR (iron transport regulator)
MTGSCERWIALADRQAQGETLTAQEQQWRRAHAERCPACTAETRFWSHVEGILSHPEYLDAPISTTPPAAKWYRRAAVWAMACAASLALGAGLYGFVFAKLPVVASTATPIAASRLVTVSGAVSIGTETAQAGRILTPSDELVTETGRVCVRASSSIVTCLDEHTHASVLAQKSGSVQIRLTQGTVLSRLARQPQDKPFSVHTPMGTITAKGTVFSVEAKQQQVYVRLYEGQLALETASHQSFSLVAPGVATLGETVTPRGLTQADSELDQNLLALTDYLHEIRDRNTTVHLSLSTEPLSARITLDGVALGHTPLSAFVPGGEHLAVELTGYAPIAEVLPKPAGQTIARHFTLSKLAPVAQASTMSESAPVPLAEKSAPSAAELLAQAQKWRAQGKYEACASAYRKLIAAYPGSHEAHVSRVSLGELSLRQLGQPEAALRAFDQYLERGGPLTREARYGKIQALEQLGRRTEAEALTQVFLRNHPQSVQAETLRRKLEIR